MHASRALPRPLLSRLLLPRPLLPLLLLLCALPLRARADRPLSALFLEAEAGPAFVFQNDNRYGASGTRYTARDVQQRDILLPSPRLSLEARLGERHGLVLLYAPFDVTTRATLSRDVDFRGTVFPTGSVVDHRYVFDGYRASYLFRLVDGAAVRWDVGASLQVRSALVQLSRVDGSLQARERDIGLVPALKTRLAVHFPWRLWAGLEADGLSTFGLAGDTEGGLYDVALTLGIPLAFRNEADVYLRLRLLGGGAEVPQRDIFNWANIGFAVIGARLDLNELADRVF
jgi:hypothetical protein